jgi:hypothetical protein
MMAHAMRGTTKMGMPVEVKKEWSAMRLGAQEGVAYRCSWRKT